MRRSLAGGNGAGTWRWRMGSRRVWAGLGGVCGVELLFKGKQSGIGDFMG